SEGLDAVYVAVCRLSNGPCNIPTTKDLDAKRTARLFFFTTSFTTIHSQTQLYPIVIQRSQRELMTIMQAKQRMAVSKRAKADGRDERQIRALEYSLGCAVSHYGDDWMKMLPTVEYAHATLVSTPKSVAQKMSRSRQEAAEFAQLKRDKRNISNRGRKQVQFSEGDLVYIDSRVLSNAFGQPDYDPDRDLNRNKLLPKWYGPFPVERRIGENAYRVAVPNRYLSRGRHATFNVDHVKLSLDVPEIFEAGRSQRVHLEYTTKIEK
ncbi:hypothetical protein GN958_ATG22939, partial [Phytophthora infestans]